LASEGSSLVRGMLKSISGWRLRHGRYEFPLEQKLFDIYVRLTGQSLDDAIEHDRTSGVTPHPVQS
ncbi:MAG: hypothetical protein O7B99_07830, partial [Planctomycetota bacterium]|nr:hypothetical protein [Planctomycetota bacterium]